MSTDIRIAVHTDPPERRPAGSWSPGWSEALERRGVAVVRVDFRGPDIVDRIRGCHGAMWHWFHSPQDKRAAPNILSAVEFGLRLPVFPNFATRWHFDEKLAQHYFLAALDVPRVPSRVFWSRDEAMAHLRACRYPAVFKLSVGAGSVNVVRLDTREEAEAVVSRMFDGGIASYTLTRGDAEDPAAARGGGNFRQRLADAVRYAAGGTYPQLPPGAVRERGYAYVQEFVPGNLHDIRVTVIGNRAFGFIRRNREGDFRASGSGLIDHDPANIPPEAVRIAHDVSRNSGFQSMAYDFLVSDRGLPLLNEISYGYVSAAVRDCPGHWDRDLAWRPGQVVPEEAHVDDFLHLVRHGRLP